MTAKAQTATSAKALILLVDDDPAVRRSLQLLLRSAQYDVRAYTTGAALLADVGSRQGACLIADFRMPDVDGVELLKRIHASGWAGPAILITGFSTADLLTRAAAGGFGWVLDKPLVERALLAAVEDAIGR